jgi:hypothetical protein
MERPLVTLLRPVERIVIMNFFHKALRITMVLVVLGRCAVIVKQWEIDRLLQDYVAATYERFFSKVRSGSN